MRAWLATRTPPPPDALPLALPDGDGEVGACLGEAAAAALGRALAGEGERAGAYDLLAADGLITYACEHAASTPDPEVELLRVLDRIGRPGG